MGPCAEASLRSSASSKDASPDFAAWWHSFSEDQLYVLRRKRARKGEGRCARKGGEERSCGGVLEGWGVGRAGVVAAAARCSC
jgi:hypothetical protein